MHLPYPLRSEALDLLKPNWNDFRCLLFHRAGVLAGARRGATRKMRRNMRSSITFVAAAALTAAWLLPDSTANAQAQSPSQAPTPGMSQPSPNISDQKLDATATAIERVTTLRQDYQKRMATAAPSDKERLAAEANDKLAKAVTDQGLSVEEFNSIVQVAKNDPAIEAKLLQRLKPSAP
jgi:hypothetical protein